LTIGTYRIIVKKEVAEEFAKTCKDQQLDSNAMIEGYMKRFIERYKK
jgi:hypothetical protein